jgi:trans-aconitate methyltransferase
LGLDLSPTAIAQATSAASPNTRFEIADFTTWRSEGAHDVIVFNESIYYARDPIAQLARYAEYLADGGVMVVSMVRSSMNAGIARRVRRQFEILHSSVIRNERADTWEVSVIRPIDSAGSTSNSFRNI